MATARLGYAAPGYPPSDYPPPGYPPPDYPQPGYVPDAYGDAVYPGYSYNNGVHTIVEGGMAMPLVLFGGDWGYYDRERHWHRAPDPVVRHLHEHPGPAWFGRSGGPPPGGVSGSQAGR